MSNLLTEGSPLLTQKENIPSPTSDLSALSVHHLSSILEPESTRTLTIDLKRLSRIISPPSLKMVERLYREISCGLVGGGKTLALKRRTKTFSLLARALERLERPMAEVIHAVLRRGGDSSAASLPNKLSRKIVSSVMQREIPSNTLYSSRRFKIQHSGGSDELRKPLVSRFDALQDVKPAHRMLTPFGRWAYYGDKKISVHECLLGKPAVAQQR